MRWDRGSRRAPVIHRCYSNLGAAACRLTPRRGLVTVGVTVVPDRSGGPNEKADSCAELSALNITFLRSSRGGTRTHDPGIMSAVL